MADSWVDGLTYELMGTSLWAYVALVATFVGTYSGYRVLIRLLEPRWFLALAGRELALYAACCTALRPNSGEEPQ